MTLQSIHLGPASAPPAQQLVLAPALHRLLASHAAVPVEARITSAAAKGRARVLDRLLEFRTAKGIPAELAGPIHASALLVVARNPLPRPTAATRRVTRGVSRFVRLPGLDAPSAGEGEELVIGLLGLRLVPRLRGQQPHVIKRTPHHAFQP